MDALIQQLNAFIVHACDGAIMDSSNYPLTVTGSD